MEDEKFALLKITPVDENGEEGEPIPIGYGNTATAFTFYQRKAHGAGC